MLEPVVCPGYMLLLFSIRTLVHFVYYADYFYVTNSACP